MGKKTNPKVLEYLDDNNIDYKFVNGIVTVNMFDVRNDQYTDLKVMMGMYEFKRVSGEWLDAAIEKDLAGIYDE